MHAIVQNEVLFILFLFKHVFLEFFWNKLRFVPYWTIENDIV